MNFKPNKVAGRFIAVMCFCRHSILDDVKSVAAGTVASLFSGLGERVCINLRTEWSSLVAIGIGKCFFVAESLFFSFPILFEKGYEHKYVFSL